MEKCGDFSCLVTIKVFCSHMLPCGGQVLVCWCDVWYDVWCVGVVCGVCEYIICTMCMYKYFQVASSSVWHATLELLFVFYSEVTWHAVKVW